MNEHETWFVNTFVLKEWRERFFTMLPREKSRRNAIHDLNGSRRLDDRKLEPIPKAHCRTAEDLTAYIQSKNPGTMCRIMSSDEYDEREVTVAEGVASAYYMGLHMVLLFYEQGWAYFQSEYLEEQYLLVNKTRKKPR